MNKRGCASHVVVVVLLILAAAGAGWYWWNKVRPGQPPTTPSGSETVGWETYRSEEYGFGFQYPEAWSAFRAGEQERIAQQNGDILFSFEFEKKEYETVPQTLEISVVPGGAGSAQASIEAIQRVIDENYVTPPEVSGAETCYACESMRYTISNLQSAQGVQIYHYDYVGKYTIIESYFYFDTNKGKTVIIKAVSENQDFPRAQPLFGVFLGSVTLN